MPNVPKEVLDLIKQVARFEERLDTVREEIADLAELRKQIANHEHQLSGHSKWWDRGWQPGVGLLIAIVSGVVGAAARGYFSHP
jgi:hypothetical protein